MRTKSTKIEKIVGCGVHVPGSKIDTDEIIPANPWLKAVTFTGIEKGLFANSRKQHKERHGTLHPLDRPENAGCSILLVDADFGIGSSREHAPQAIKRWGFDAVIATTPFADIFSGNAASIGLACAVMDPDDHAELLSHTKDPGTLVVDLEDLTVTYGNGSGRESHFPLTMPEADRKALVEGTWDTIGMLREAADQVAQVASRRPTIQLVAA